MSKPTALSPELANAIAWLQRQPGVTSVVPGRYTRASHHHAVGYARVSRVDDKTVHLRAYDKLGTKDLFVHAPKSPQRDAWLALLAAGDVVGANSSGPKIAAAKPVVQVVTGEAALKVPQPVTQIVARDAAQIFDITPELALQWLEHNTRNRTLKQSVVNRYAADMRAGRWLVSGDAITFDTNGAILEGQHRLWAVVEANMTVRMLVMFGAHPDVIEVVGDHLRRSFADVAKIRRPGTLYSTVFTSIANALLKSSIRVIAVDRRATLERVSRQTQLEWLDRHHDAIAFAVRECFRSASLRSVTTAQVLAPVARAYYTQDQERLRQFGRVMLTGMTETAEDNAAIVLRNFLLRQTTAGMRASGDIIYRKTERALQAFVERQKLATLYEAAEELFPLPEDSPGVKGKAR